MEQGNAIAIPAATSFVIGWIVDSELHCLVLDWHSKAEAQGVSWWLIHEYLTVSSPIWTLKGIGPSQIGLLSRIRSHEDIARWAKFRSVCHRVDKRPVDGKCSMVGKWAERALSAWVWNDVLPRRRQVVINPDDLLWCATEVIIILTPIADFDDAKLAPSNKTDSR
jgi:hypothetical protein